MSQPTNFYLAVPELIPEHVKFLEISPIVLETTDHLLAFPLTLPDRTFHQTLQSLLDRLNTSHRGFSKADNVYKGTKGNEDNDQAFNIVRSTDNLSLLILSSALEAFNFIFKEAMQGGTTLDQTQWGRLIYALHALLKLFKSEQSHTHNPPLVSPPALENTQRDALQRWTKGHYVFMVFCQGLILAIKSFRNEVSANNTGSARYYLNIATSIMWGVESSFRFTGDYTYSEYEKSVRPTLTPPIAPEDMSGLHWRDHEQLVKQLINTKKIFNQLPSDLHDSRESFYEAMSASYDAHKFVCTQFVGDESPSLLMQSRNQVSAADTLTNFKKSRLNTVHTKSTMS
ncbi:hypothetical protein KCM76_06480 [Zooshikella marina]|uniref:hypothetical protein n=1 Tax=Zooshikella ganghwensis TaxID=202772 RepID=UPI001BAEFC78|nr:hypothetical protein [Zooshikella ganghwensis]MBU2705618.1 hypothetical protein [Zooshikella ganghwensis]